MNKRVPVIKWIQERNVLDKSVFDVGAKSRLIIHPLDPSQASDTEGSADNMGQSSVQLPWAYSLIRILPEIKH